MIRLNCVLLLAVSILVFVGCNPSQKVDGCAVVSSGLTKVVVDGNELFPQFLEGQWRDFEYGWSFTFDSCGQMSSAVIDSGMLEVQPGKTTYDIELVDSGSGTYVLGEPWIARYSPENRQLLIEVVIDSYALTIPPYSLAGSSVDRFIGSISTDAQRWSVDWYHYPVYIAYTPEPGELAFDPNSNPLASMVFRKQ